MYVKFVYLIFHFCVLLFMFYNEFITETIVKKKYQKYDNYFQKQFLQLAQKYKYLIKNDNNIEDNYPIWIMNYDGIENSPPNVKAFISSIEMNSGNHPFYKLDKHSYNKYIILPKFIIDKFNDKIINIPHFLEILRMGILSKFGGYWIDITNYNINPPVSIYSSLFTYKLTKCNQKITKILKPNNFLISSKNSFLTTYSYNAFLIYWNHNKYNKISLLDNIIHIGYQNENEFKKYIDKIPYIDCSEFSLNKLIKEDDYKRMISYKSTKTTIEEKNGLFKNETDKTNYTFISKNEEKKNDFCIVGLWYATNYGSMATYYALHQTIAKMGYSLMMIDNPVKKLNSSLLKKSHPYNLARLFYNVSSEKNLHELYKLNKECKGFIVGSDQLWNLGISKYFGNLHFLGFVDDNIKKISYATSFGHPYKGSKEETKTTLAYLRRFDGISVRDKLSFDTCRKKFGLKNVVQVCDPTFLCDISDYEILLNISKIKETDPYYLAYVLDPTPIIGHRLEQLSIDKNMKVIIILDELQRKYEMNKQNLSLSGKGKIELKKSMNLYDWMWYFNHSKGVFTDSFHGTIFSIIFKKPFITLKNKKRGPSRFISLLKPISLIHRLFNSSECINERDYLLDNCDYSIPYKKLNKIKEYSIRWLKNNLNKK